MHENEHIERLEQQLADVRKELAALVNEVVELSKELANHKATQYHLGIEETPQTERVNGAIPLQESTLFVTERN